MFNGSKFKLVLSTGLGVVGIGIAALAATPVYAATTGSTTANATVNSSVTLSGLSPNFTIAGAPLTTATGLSAVTMNAKTNNKTGYNVTVQAAAATMTGAIAGNTDTIPVSALSVRNTTTGGAYTAISNTASVQVANTTAKSTSGGDTVNNDYQVAIPWVNADTYSVTLNYILANNP
jgi:hypothetical protein